MNAKCQLANAETDLEFEKSSFCNHHSKDCFKQKTFIRVKSKGERDFAEEQDVWFNVFPQIAYS